MSNGEKAPDPIRPPEVEKDEVVEDVERATPTPVSEEADELAEEVPEGGYVERVGPKITEAAGHALAAAQGVSPVKEIPDGAVVLSGEVPDEFKEADELIGKKTAQPPSEPVVDEAADEAVGRDVLMSPEGADVQPEGRTVAEPKEARIGMAKREVIPNFTSGPNGTHIGGHTYFFVNGKPVTVEAEAAFHLRRQGKLR